MTETIQLPLDPSSSYHARVVATNPAGEGVSADVPLWTDAAGRILDFEPEAETPEVPEPTPTPEPAKTQGNSEQAHTNGNGNDDVVHAADPPVAPPVLGKSVVVNRPAAR